MAFSKEDLAIMETIIKRYPRPRSAIMPLLHFVQSRAGYVTTVSYTHLTLPTKRIV